MFSSWFRLFNEVVLVESLITVSLLATTTTVSCVIVGADDTWDDWESHCDTESAFKSFCFNSANDSSLECDVFGAGPSSITSQLCDCTSTESQSLKHESTNESLVLLVITLGSLRFDDVLRRRNDDFSILFDFFDVTAPHILIFFL